MQRVFFIVAVSLLQLACSNEVIVVATPTLMPPTPSPIPRSSIQAELESVFEFEPLDLSDGQPAVIGRKDPYIYKRERVEVILIGPEDELTGAQIRFSTEIDGIDAMDVGRIIGMIAPDDRGFGLVWVDEGYRSGWSWPGYPVMNGRRGAFIVQTDRSYFPSQQLSFITVSFSGSSLVPVSMPTPSLPQSAPVCPSGPDAHGHTQFAPNRRTSDRGRHRGRYGESGGRMGLDMLSQKSDLECGARPRGRYLLRCQQGLRHNRDIHDQVAYESWC